MSVVVVASHAAVDDLLIGRLAAQGDVVGLVVEEDAGPRPEDGPAHVARGSTTDDDLIERAALHARTIVVHEDRGRPAQLDVVRAVVAAAVRLGGVRVVVWGARHSRETMEILESSGLSFVAITTGRLRGGFRRGVPLEAVVEAIDAADDLAGDPRLHVDLTRPDDRARLGVMSPD